LHKELAKWITLETKMPKGIVKVDAEKDVCHFALVIKVLMQYFFPKNGIDILSMLKLTKAQQISTFKASASKINCEESNVFKGHRRYTNICSNSLCVSLDFE
jgi:hypothetical protein